MSVPIDLQDRVIALGDEHLYKFKPLPNWGMITEAFYHEDNYYEPIDYSKLASIIPANFMARVKLLLDNGIEPIGYIIRHDPEKEKKEEPKRNIPLGKIALAISAVILAPIVLVVSFAVVMMLAMPLLALAVLVITGGMVDPELIAVLPDGSWISLGEYYA
ncbi:MAG TPA: hypothetical protein VJ327_09785 [Patescibacteria group bacterium]|nr:MAG: hypothetical protein A2899_02900 [Candidatus Amesbacteria bacterium RIFCSPLOWO2_01_FULL_49_25]HJZ06116.1 hypothetical protein [Patescibacteria group bacterium]